MWSCLEKRKSLKSTAPPNIDQNKTLPHPLDSGDAKHAKNDSLIQPSPAQRHQIKKPITCKSKDIYYLINCKHCNQQYTGETKREFHLRINSHTSDIKLTLLPTGGGGLFGPHHQAGSQNPRTLSHRVSKISDFFFMLFGHIVAKFQVD